MRFSLEEKNNESIDLDIYTFSLIAHVDIVPLFQNTFSQTFVVKGLTYDETK